MRLEPKIDNARTVMTVQLNGVTGDHSVDLQPSRAKRGQVLMAVAGETFAISASTARALARALMAVADAADRGGTPEVPRG